MLRKQRPTAVNRHLYLIIDSNNKIEVSHSLLVHRFPRFDEVAAFSEQDVHSKQRWNNTFNYINRLNPQYL